MPDDRWEGPGVPSLLELLATVCGESVYLRYAPPPANESIRWCVYPQDRHGQPLAEGPTVYRALQSAFETVVSRIFRGQVPASGQPWREVSC